MFSCRTRCQTKQLDGGMELEVFIFVFCIKNLDLYLQGKHFTVRTDHKNLVYLSNSTVSKLVKWRVLLSEFRFQIEHIPGAQNVVADEVTMIFTKNCLKISSVALRTIQLSAFFEDIKDENPGDSYEEGDKIVALGPG